MHTHTPARSDPAHWSLKEWHQFNKPGPDRGSAIQHNTAALSVSLLTNFPSWLPPFPLSSSSAKQSDDNFVLAGWILLSVMTQIFISSAIKKWYIECQEMAPVSENCSKIISCWNWVTCFFSFFLIFSTFQIILNGWSGILMELLSSPL